MPNLLKVHRADRVRHMARKRKRSDRPRAPQRDARSAMLRPLDDFLRGAWRSLCTAFPTFSFWLAQVVGAGAFVVVADIIYGPVAGFVAGIVALCAIGILIALAELLAEKPLPGRFALAGALGLAMIAACTLLGYDRGLKDGKILSQSERGSPSSPIVVNLPTDQGGTTITRTCASDGTEAVGEVVLPPTTYNGRVSNIRVVQEDLDGCRALLSETGARDGQVVEIMNMSPNVLLFGDIAVTQNVSGEFVMGQHDLIRLRYMLDRPGYGEWVEVSRVDN